MVDNTGGVKIDNCFQHFAASAEYSYLRPCRSPLMEECMYVCTDVYLCTIFIAVCYQILKNICPLWLVSANVLRISVINLVSDTKHISRQILVFRHLNGCMCIQ